MDPDKLESLYDEWRLSSPGDILDEPDPISFLRWLQSECGYVVADAGFTEQVIAFVVGDDELKAAKALRRVAEEFAP